MQLSVGALGAFGIIGLLSLLLDVFGLAVAVIAADYAFRRNRSPLNQAWKDARRKASDIVLASLGIAFVMFLPALLGGLLSPLVPLVQAVAFVFVIYIDHPRRRDRRHAGTGGAASFGEFGPRQSGGDGGFVSRLLRFLQFGTAHERRYYHGTGTQHQRRQHLRNRYDRFSGLYPCVLFRVYRVRAFAKAYSNISYGRRFF